MKNKCFLIIYLIQTADGKSFFVFAGVTTGGDHNAHTGLIIPFDLDLMELISSMEPHGEGNPAPVFCSRGLTVKSPPSLMGKDTIKFWVSDGTKTISAVGFGMGSFKDRVKLGGQVDLAYSLSIDDWNKAPAVQLMLKDIR